MKNIAFMFKKLSLFTLLLAVPVMFYGQNTTKKDKKNEKKKTTTVFTPHWFLQGDFGLSWPWADVSTTHLVPDLRSNVINVNGNVALGYQFNSWMSLYGNFNRGFANGRLSAGKNSLPRLSNRALLFKSDFYGPDLNLGFNLSNILGGTKDRKFFVGAHVGIGQIQWKSKLFNGTTNQFIQSIGYDNAYDNAMSKIGTGWQGKGVHKRKIAMDIPIGVNLNYKINDTWTLYGDYTYSWLDTDILDGITSGGHDALLRANVGLRLNLNNAFSGIKPMATKFDQNVKMTATPNPLVKKGKDIAVNISGTVAPKYFNKKAVMMIQPVFTYDGGQTMLKPVVLKGEQVSGAGQPISYANGGSFKYNTTIPYKKGMEAADLHTTPVVYMYSGQDFNSAKEALASGKRATQIHDVKLADGTIVTADDVQMTPWGAQSNTMAPTAPGQGFVYNFAPSGYEKVTVKTTTSAIHFRVNIAKLEWGLKLNRNKDNYDALKNNLADLQKGWAVKGIEIDGWASPEGPVSFNNTLSGYRAQTAKKYIEAKIKRELRKKDNGFAFKSVKDVSINTVANGPDWNGFMKAVKNSDIKDKSSILNVINSQVESQRQSEIKNMIAVYPQIEKKILPALRRAVIKVNAFEPKKTDAQILQMATGSDYAQLSVPELLYAATLTKDLNTKVEIYKNLMNKEPRCWRAVANAGAVETAMGNMSEAKTLLMKAEKMNPKSAEVENSLGIMEARMGNFDQATMYFTKAQKLGANENNNLGIMNIVNGNYQEAVNLLNGNNCDYNLGLAQMLNGNNSAASSTLQCASKNAHTEYLLAVLNAREGNKAEMMSHLTSAIKMDSKLASKAAQDREFVKYFNEPGFKTLVGSK